MTMQSVIDTLPDQAKRSVLFSLLGSINASLVGTASSAVSRLQRDGYDIRDLSTQDVERLLSEADARDDMMHNVKRLARVGQSLRDQLIELTNDDSQGSIAGTIKFMSVPTTRKVNTDLELLGELFALAGVTDIDTTAFAAMREVRTQQRDIQRAERLAAQAGEIEWMIDMVFVPPSTDETHYEDEERADGSTFSRAIVTRHDVDVQLEELSEETRERLIDKMNVALKRALDDGIMGVLDRDRRYTMSDVAVIAGAIKTINEIDYAVSAPVTKSKVKKVA
jgi:hypothetical protein